MLSFGVIRERKTGELRVGLIPQGVSKLVEEGHSVYVEENAGVGSGWSDEEYLEAGAAVVRSPEMIASLVDVLVKVKEPTPEEYPLLKMLYGKTIVAYLHLAASPEGLIRELLKNCITGISYEIVESFEGGLPLLKPMSEIAGISAVQDAAQYLKRKYGGCGVTLGRLTGMDSARVVIFGGGSAGVSAFRTALGMGAYVTLFELDPKRRARLSRDISAKFGPRFSDYFRIAKPDEPCMSQTIRRADVLIGAVSLRGARAPEVVNERHVCSMKDGAVIVDISIDQGGCVWGSRTTTHENPIYTHAGKIYSCVTNIPGQVPRQATIALTNATFPMIFSLAYKGVENALLTDAGLCKGLATYKGKVASKEIAAAHDMVDRYESPEKLLERP